MGKRKKTTEEFKQEVYDLVGDEYSVLGEYIDSKTPILIKHYSNNCENSEWKIIPVNFLRRANCPICSRLNQYKKQRKTTEEFKQEVYDLVGDEYSVLGEYNTRDIKILVRHNCEKCDNHEFEMTPGNFLSGQRCPKCKNRKLSESQSKTLNEFKQEVYDLVGDEYSVLGKSYTNRQTKILMKHNCEKCDNHEFEMRPAEFIYQGNRCPKCKIIRLKETQTKTTEEFKQEVYDLVGDEYSVLGEYNIGHSKILMKHNCEKCNNYEWEITPHNFLQGHRCPKCCFNSGESKEEILLREFIQSQISCKLKEDSTRILNGKDIDILTENNIGFEYDGLYWHSEKFCDKNYHLNKILEAKDKNIRLIHIFSDEWLNKQEIVKSKIINIIGKNNNSKIYARKCKIKLIDSKLKNKFLEKNHIQGADRSNIKLGLFYENNLVSVMTFCKPRLSLGQKKDSLYDYELSRFASDINYHVIGAFGKLFKYFERNYKWNKIITYADKRWSEGNVYIKNGWKYLHDSNPNYWYTDGHNRYHRFNFRLSKLKDSKEYKPIYDKLLKINNKVTEKMIMEQTNLIRIWDCGNMVFEYKRNTIN